MVSQENFPSGGTGWHDRMTITMNYMMFQNRFAHKTKWVPTTIIILVLYCTVFPGILAFKFPLNVGNGMFPTIFLFIINVMYQLVPTVIMLVYQNF